MAVSKSPADRVGLCARHAAKLDRWLDVAPDTATQIMNSRASVQMISITPNVARAREAVSARADNYAALVHQQMRLITEACGARRGCSDELAEVAS